MRAYHEHSEQVIKIYLLLTEFKVRTVNYGPGFFLLIYGPSAKRMGHSFFHFVIFLRIIRHTGKETS